MKLLVIDSQNPLFYLQVVIDNYKDSEIFAIFNKRLSTEIQNQILKINENSIFIDDFDNDIYIQAKKLCQNQQFDLLVNQREPEILVGGLLRDEFKIKGQTYKSAQCFKNKILMKQALQQSGLKVPQFSKLALETEQQFLGSVLQFLNGISQNKDQQQKQNLDLLELFPVIIKPDDMSGSRNVFIVKTQEELKKCFEFIKNEKNQYQIEEYISGEMYHIDGLIYNGTVIFAWPSRYYNTCMDVKFENISCSYNLQQGNPLVKQLQEFATKVLIVLQENSNCKISSAFHMEVFGNQGDFVFCEVACRVGGCDIYKYMIRSYGFNIIEEHCLLSIEKFKQLQIQVQENQIFGVMHVPSVSGKIVNIEQQCPIDGVFNYKSYFKNDDEIQMFDIDGYKIFLAMAEVLGKNEEEILNNTVNFEKWFHQTFKIV